MSKTSLLAGIAGEYFVAAELSRRGYIASITLRNTRGIDILATNSEATHNVTIQCKTSRGFDKKWILTDKSESFISDTHFYIFVELGTDTKRPSYHIVPSKDVATYISTSHKKWMNGTKSNKQPRKNSSIRVFNDKESSYADRWDLLGL